MDLIFTSVYKIDYDAQEIIEVIPKEKFSDFVIRMMRNIDTNIITKLYKPLSQTRQVVSDVRNMISVIEHEQLSEETYRERLNAYMVDIAERLLEKEIVKQEQISQMGQNVKKGSLIQAIIKKEDKYSYLLAKVEHSNFFDDADFSLKTGFSDAQKNIWKTCVLECKIEEESVTIEEARVYINNSAKYWAEDFLELKEVSSDALNTKKAFKAIETVLNQNLKPKYPADYTIIRNAFVGYMKREQQLNFDDMVEGILGTYLAEELRTDEISNLKKKLLELPEKSKFDRLFTVVPKEIKAKIKKVYTVNEGIEIKIHDYLDNFREIIMAQEDVITGAKYIKIRTNNEDVYRQFK